MLHGKLSDQLPNPSPAAALQARLKNPRNAQLWLAAVRTELRAQNVKAGESLMAKALQVGGWAAVRVGSRADGEAGH